MCALSAGPASPNQADNLILVKVSVPIKQSTLSVCISTLGQARESLK